MKIIRPHDLVAEESFLSCLIKDNEYFYETDPYQISSDDFYSEEHGLIYKVFSELVTKSISIDVNLLCVELNTQNLLEQAGGERKLKSLGKKKVSALNFKHFVKSIKVNSTLREIQSRAELVTKICQNYTGDVNNIIQEIDSTFNYCFEKMKESELMPINVCLKNNLKQMDESSKSSGHLTGLPTGYPALDRLSHGLKEGELIVIGGRPAMGKTSFALNVVLNAVEKSELPVAIFSAAEPEVEISSKLMSIKGKVPRSRIMGNDLFDSDLKNIGKAVQSLSALPIFIEHQEGISLSEIKSSCHKLSAQMGLGLVVIDNLQLANITGGLKELAQELRVPVIVLSQLSRRVENRPDKRPRISDLRDAESLEEAADSVWLLYRDEYYKAETEEPGVTEVIVSKNRKGEVGTVKLAFIGATMSFENLEA